MTMKRNTILIITGLLIMAASCEKSEYLSEGDFFHLSHKGAKMPVWVMGNFNSDVILITVHGGPGDAGMGFHLAPGFQKLEQDYMIAYWDQRFSGMTQGHYDRSTMQPEQFIEDTDRIVKLIQDRYPGKKLFMLGHSWGGALSAGYLGRNNHADDFRGWIDLNGGIYAELEAQLMREWILPRIPEKLAEPDADTEFWQYILDWYEANPNPTGYSDYEPYWYTSALGGDVYDLDAYFENNPIPYGELILRSMFSFSYYINSFAAQKGIKAWDEVDYTEELHNISIPSLMLWGANDAIVPVQVADYVYDHLGTEASMKRVVLIEQCGHGPQSEKPEEFYAEISSFIETYK